MTAQPAGTQQPKPMFQILKSEFDKLVKLPNAAFKGMSFEEVDCHAQMIAKIADNVNARVPVKIPLPYTKININVKVGVPNEEFGRRSEL